MYYFSDSYEQARRNFHTLCNNLGLAITSHINPTAKSPSGGALATDVVWCGRANAKKVLLVTCGVHGLEAGPGSATIVQWLHTKRHEQLPKDTAVMIVHGVNPYGWAYASRNNEDNIDLNRNYLDHGVATPKPENQAYVDLHAQVLRDEVSNRGLADAIDRYHAYAESHGVNQAIHGITAGQYSHSDGIGFGGNHLSWSFATLKSELKERLNGATKVVLIDWHTGIGEYAKPFFIFRDPAGSTPFLLASKWWGEDSIHVENIFSDSDNPEYTGLLVDGLKNEVKAINGAEVVAVTVELGTFELDAMLQAIFMDRWLRIIDRNPESVQSIQLKTRLIERFYPSMPCWRNSVLHHSKKIYEDTLVGIDNWQ